MIDLAARLGDRRNIYYPPGVESAEDLDGVLAPMIERFDERCAAHGRSEKDRRSIAFDVAPGLQPANRRELGELVVRMSELGYDECIAWGWPPSGNRSIAVLLAFVTDDLPGLRTV